jgi:trans-aconitate methyltransferase
MATEWGVKDIVALDLGEAAEVAFEGTRDLPNVHVVQGDLLQPCVARQSFDVAFSIGVLHHLQDPRGGFARLVSLVKVDGIVACWVYGRENNEWIVRLVNPVRERVTSKMPHNLLYWASLPVAVGLTAWSRLYRTQLSEHLPYAPYMKLLSAVPVREVQLVVYDQLVTPLAEYLPREEIESWFRAENLPDARIRWHNEHSWACSAVVPERRSSASC